MITEKQRIDRQAWIGASDVPTILGLNPYKTALSLWYEKTGQSEPFEGNEATRRGDYMEIALFAFAQDRLKMPVYKGRSTYKCRHLPILRANIDGFVGRVAKGAPIVECKSSLVEWGDTVPEMVYAQVQAELFAADSMDAYVAYAGPNFRFDLFGVVRDDVYLAGMADVLKEFWQHVLDHEKPDPERWGGLSKDDRIKPEAVHDDAPQIPSALMHEYALAKDAMAEAEANYKSVQDRIRGHLGGASRGVANGWKISNHFQSRSGLDTDAIKNDMPEIVEKYTKVTQFPVLRVTKEKP